MSNWVRRLDQRFYPDVRKNWDDRLLRGAVLDLLRPESVILDFGAGAGIVEQMDFRGYCARICGVDLDERVCSNPYLDEGKVGSGEAIPYPDNAFDVVVSNNVLEHLDTPAPVFAEISRVLRPGGTFIFKTPNKTHYMPVIARLTPHRFHAYVNRLRGRAEVDTFPTRYRANSCQAIRKLADSAGLEVRLLERIEGRPEYLRLAAPLYLFGIGYERLVNSFERLAPLRILLMGQLVKTESA